MSLGSALFSLFGRIFIDNQEANESMAKTEEQGQKMGISLGDAFAGIGKAALGIGTAVVGASTAVVGGLMAMANDTASYADEIDKLSERTGINREELQRWKYAAGQSGADIGKLEVGIKTLSASMVSAADGGAKQTAAFEALGISLEDLANKSQEEIFDSVITGLAGMEQGAERNALGNSLLGKSYTELLPLINAGADGIDELKTRADELGLVMSEDAILAGVAFGDTMDDVNLVLGTLGKEVGQVVMPKLTEFLNFILDKVPTIRGYVDQVAEVAETALTFVVDRIIPPLTEGITWIIDNLDILVPLVGAIGTAFLTWNVVTMVQGIATAIKGFTFATEGATLAQQALNLVMANNPIGIVISVIAALAAGIVVLWNTNEDFRNACIEIWGNIKTKAEEIWGRVTYFFTDTVPKAIDDFIAFFTNFPASMAGLLTEAVGYVKQFAADVIDEAMKLPARMLEIGGEIVAGVVNGISGAFSGAMETVGGFFTGILDGAKELLGIQSPSKVFADQVGKQIALGVADGVDKEADKVAEAATKLARDAYTNAKRWIDDYRNSTDYLAAEEQAMWGTLREAYGDNIEFRIEIDKNINRLRAEEEKKAFDLSKDYIAAQKQLREMNADDEIAAWQRVAERYGEGTELRKKADDELFKARIRIRDEEEAAQAKALADQEKLLAEQQKAAEEQIKLQQKLAEDQAAVMQKMTDAENQYIGAVQNRSKSIAGAFSLFSELSDKEAASSKELMANLTSQVEAMKQWSTELAELSAKGIDEGLLQQLREMGPQAYKEISALNGMTEEELEKYSALWREKNELATDAAVEELQGLRLSTNEELNKLSEEMKALTGEQISPIGAEMIQDITAGVKAETPALDSAINIALVKQPEAEANKLLEMTKAKQVTYVDTWKNTYQLILQATTSSMQNVRAVAETEMNTLLNTLQTLVNDMAFNIGASLGYDLAQGLMSQQAAVLSQAMAMAQAIRNAFAATATTTTGGGQSTYIPSHATGLDYVPYDNYTANLHRGEAVLTAAEAEDYRAGGGGTTINQYFYGVREEQTAFEVKRAAEKAAREVLQ